MNHEDFYDVVIIGAGPAGLSVGSELSKELKVLLIEKNKAGETSRSWFVPLDVANRNEDVKEFTYGGIKRYLARTFSGADICWDVRLFERYPFVKEKEILPYWANVIRENHSEIIDECFYLDHAVENEIVTIYTSEGNFNCKLLIDASGYDSVILKKYGIKQDYYWWTIYGCIAKHKIKNENIKVGDYMLWQTFKDTNVDLETSLQKGRPIFEYLILSEDTCLIYVLYLGKERTPLDLAKQVFMHMLREEEATKDFHDVEIIEEKFGYYPSGGIPEKIAKDHVDFIGDAGCWTTPCGWGMAFILDNYKRYARNIINLVKENKLNEHNLNSWVELSVYEKHQFLFDQIITHFLSNGSAQDLDRFIEFFHVIDPLLCEKVFTLRITPEELKIVLKAFLKHFDLKELINIIPKEDYLLMLDEVKDFLEEYIIEEVLHIHREKESGYSFGCWS